MSINVESKNLDMYLNQDIDNPKYLFHGSPKKISKLVPILSYDSNGDINNIAEAVFLFPSFLKSTPYAFKDTIKRNSEGLDWNFEIPNNNDFPLMKMSNVNIDEDIIGYIYVFYNNSDMIKDDNSYQYKCYKEIIPIDVIEVCYKDYSKYYEIISKRNINKPYILKAPISLNYITNNLDDILIDKIEQYKELFKIKDLEPIKINFFDDKQEFREFIHKLRGERESLPEYAVGTFDNDMINAYIEKDIPLNSSKYKKTLYMASHELFHILYKRYILKNDFSKRIVWYDEGMAQFLSGEKDELLDRDNFNNFYLKVKENTHIKPNLNELKHGTNFCNDNYNGYNLSYLCIRYLNEILSSAEFKNLMSDFDKIKEYGNEIVNEMFMYYDNRLINKTRR